MRTILMGKMCFLWQNIPDWFVFIFNVENEKYYRLWNVILLRFWIYANLTEYYLVYPVIDFLLNKWCLYMEKISIRTVHKLKCLISEKIQQTPPFQDVYDIEVTEGSKVCSLGCLTYWETPRNRAANLLINKLLLPWFYSLFFFFIHIPSIQYLQNLKEKANYFCNKIKSRQSLPVYGNNPKYLALFLVLRAQWVSAELNDENAGKTRWRNFVFNIFDKWVCLNQGCFRVQWLSVQFWSCNRSYLHFQ